MFYKNKVSKANSIYMKTQMKMISMEYVIPIDYCDQKDLKINNKNDNIDEEKNTLKKIISMMIKMKVMMIMNMMINIIK